MIKKLVAISSATAMLLITAMPALASSGENLRWRKELQRKDCNPTGRVVVNVVQKVQNDADSGFGGYWAFDKYVRHIRVYQTDDDNPSTFCATVSYEGKFEGVTGQTGPGGTGTIGSDVEGRMSGGYRATITGTILDTPAWPTHGFVGVFDYQCDLFGNCPGRVSWVEQYFGPSYGFDYGYWGWIYKAGKHGTWINQCGGDIPANPACTGSSGNIL